MLIIRFGFLYSFFSISQHLRPEQFLSADNLARHHEHTVARVV
jgi:hypothetical protein